MSTRNETTDLVETNRLADQHVETVLLVCHSWLKAGIDAPVIVTALLKAAVELQDLAGLSAAQISNMFQDTANQLREIHYAEAENTPAKLN